MAKDQFVYVGEYRKCIDEIGQYKKELWLIVVDFKTDNSIKIQALKELHAFQRHILY
jgi:hypothetical protein